MTNTERLLHEPWPSLARQREAVSFGVWVFIASELAKDDEITFNAGTHAEVIRMAYGDFERLVHPRMASFAT